MSRKVFTYKEFVRARAKVYIRVHLDNTDSELWVKVVKTDLLRQLEDELIYASKFDILELDAKMFFYGVVE